MWSNLRRPPVMAALAVAIAAAGVGIYFAARHAFASGELADKAGWSALQGIEYSTRGMDCEAVTVRPVGAGAFLALGFPAAAPLDGVGDGCRSWVLLNEHAADREVKQMPRFRAYRLPCGDVADIPQMAPETDPYVIAYLESICS